MRHTILALLLSLLIPGPAGAEATGSERSYPVQIIWKLGRGIHNIVGSPHEVSANSFKEAYYAEQRGENVGGTVVGYFTGAVVGCGYMLARIGVGVFDVLSFPIPTAPVMEPAVPDGFLETVKRVSSEPWVARKRTEPEALLSKGDPAVIRRADPAL